MSPACLWELDWEPHKSAGKIHQEQKYITSTQAKPQKRAEATRGLIILIIRMMKGSSNEEENMVNATVTAAAAADVGGDEATTTKPDLHRCVTAGSSTVEGAPHHKSCDQANIQAPPDSSKDNTNNTATMLSSQHRQALAHLYHSSRRSRSCRVPSSPSAITYAHLGSDNLKLLHQDEAEKDASIHQVTTQVDDDEEEKSPTKAADVEWSFDIASLVDDCSSISSFDGEESFMDNGNIFRIESDCWQTNDSEPTMMGSDDGLHTGVEGRSSKRMRTT